MRNAAPRRQQAGDRGAPVSAPSRGPAIRRRTGTGEDSARRRSSTKQGAPSATGMLSHFLIQSARVGAFPVFGAPPRSRMGPPTAAASAVAAASTANPARACAGREQCQASHASRSPFQPPRKLRSSGTCASSTEWRKRKFAVTALRGHQPTARASERGGRLRTRTLRRGRQLEQCRAPPFRARGQATLSIRAIFQGRAVCGEGLKVRFRRVRVADRVVVRIFKT